MKAILTVVLLLTAASLRAAAPGKYAWDEDWPRFRTSEYVVTAAAAGVAAANYYWISPAKTAKWNRDVLFDKSARDALMIRDEKVDKRVTSISDAMTYGLIGYAALDGPVTARWHGGDRDSAVQLAWINAETFAVTEALNLSISNALPRARPPGDVCPADSKYDPHCTKSFWSGHAASAYAAAGLVCSEHHAMALYGGHADAVACGTTLAAASAISVLRIAENAHHASDVIVGAVVGGTTGYLMPNFLHFKFRRSRRDVGYVIPNVSPQGGGLTYVKAW